MKKLLACLIALFISWPANSCWYRYYNYEDYIFSVNNLETHIQSLNVKTASGKRTVTYTVKNNMVVDFPISVAVKLVSDNSVIIDNTSGNIYQINGITQAKKDMILRGKLQYRVLPNGNWVTVKEYSIQTGNIPSNYPPNFYFGRNNISPKCNKGDIIMIRVFVTDGLWQSGMLEDPCDNYKTDDTVGETMMNSITKSEVRTLKSNMTFTTTDDTYDLGGQWKPTLVTTVIWSGRTRAEK